MYAIYKMDQQYICFQRQIASSSSLNRRSRTVPEYHISPRESENIDSRPWQQNARYCNICLQRYCHYTEFCESLTEEEVIDPSLSGDELALVMDQLLSEMEGLDGRSAVSGVGGESYDMTQRHETGYGRVSGKEAVQNGQLQQYPNDIMGHDLTQATTWSSYDKLRTAPRTFNTSTAGSNSTAIQNDYRTTDVQNDYAGDHDDENDDDYKVHGSDEPVPGATLSGLEAHYRPSRCLLLGCKGEHLFETFDKYRSHIKNVHSKAIWCSHPSCLYPRPFANKSDVDRHYRSKHGDKSDKPFKCLHDDCPARVKAFNRKDKLREHITKYHSECCCFICPRPRWFESWEECVEHTNAAHVIHEYAAKS